MEDNRYLIPWFKRHAPWTRPLWHAIKRIKNWVRLLRAILHPSSIRIARYLLILLARRAIGVASDGYRLHSSAETQNFLPIAKEVPPEPINSEVISKSHFPDLEEL